MQRTSATLRLSNAWRMSLNLHAQRHPKPKPKLRYSRIEGYVYYTNVYLLRLFYVVVVCLLGACFTQPLSKATYALSRACVLVGYRC